MRQRKQLYEKSAAGRRIRRRRETLGITRHEIAQLLFSVCRILCLSLIHISAEFTNAKGGDVDTGVYLDNLPYIIVFAGVLAAVAVLVIRRRRVDD